MKGNISKKIKRVISFVLLTGLFFSILDSKVVTCAKNPRKNKVLYISSYAYDWESVPLQIYGMQQAIDDSCYIDYAFMDTHKIDEEKAQKMLYEQLQAKREELDRMDAVIVADDAALRFVLEYKDVLFEDKPIAFMGINDEALAIEAGKYSNITGVIEDYPIKETIEGAIKIFPQSRQVVAIYDNACSSIALIKKYQECQKDFENIKLQSINCSEYTTHEIEKKISEYSKNTILLYISFSSDYEGKTYSYVEGIEKISKAAKIPVFCMDRLGIEGGGIGGSIVSYTDMGRKAAGIISNVLKGQDIQLYPIISTPWKYVFVNECMEKYHIAKEQLPKNSEIVVEDNAETKGYYYYVNIIVGIIMFLIIIILSAELIIKRKMMKKIGDNNQNFLEKLMELNPYVMSSFQMNLSKNTIQYTICEEKDEINYHDTNYDNFVNRMRERILDKSERSVFVSAISRKNLLKAYTNQQYRITCEVHYLYKDKKNEWIQVAIDLSKNEITSDIEGVFFISNIHEYREMENIINEIVDMDYERIVVVDMISKDFILYSAKDHIYGKRCSDYIGYITETLGKHCLENSEKVMDDFSWDNILMNLNENNEYIIMLNIIRPGGGIEVKQVKFRYLNEQRNTMIVLTVDVTFLYILEKKNEANLTMALQAAERANAAKSDFLSRMSHDIRTPLNGIIGMAERVLKTDNIEEVRQYDQKIRISAKFLLGLINDILDMSKIESGNIILHPKPYEDGMLEKYIKAVITPLCEWKNISMHIDVKYHNNSMPMIDELRFHQILFNILSNSVKYTNKGGHINFSMEIVYEEENDKLVILATIEDNGIGMSKEFMDKMFDAFTQEEREQREGVNLDGTGLGLSIVKSLVELMGGKIAVRSQYNEGTEFTIKLPCKYVVKKMPVKDVEENQQENIIFVEDRWKKESIAVHNISNWNGKRILICEDKAINAEIIRLMLEERKISVLQAKNGKEAVEIIKESEEEPIDLVFMDIRMPVMNGIEATCAIRQFDDYKKRKIPIIAMTADAFEENTTKYLENGMDDYIIKPIEEEKVDEILRQYLA